MYRKKIMISNIKKYSQKSITRNKRRTELFQIKKGITKSRDKSQCFDAFDKQNKIGAQEIDCLSSAFFKRLFDADVSQNAEADVCEKRLTSPNNYKGC
ncbi:hypothetical protein CEXT_749681 [Caerostris extrusa]|uniref:Uncharacterized protein n=1 Tax=Caerostris extrusa TaxID=172846 RepID=A0AAV4PAV2_CAEEX|nr:hypothetical protein CEXT_749681 [Caerostris extrusa]